MATIAIVNGIGDTVVAFRGALVRDLVARGHAVTVSTPRPVEIDADTVARAIEALGARCVFSPLDRTGLNPLAERRARAARRADLPLPPSAADGAHRRCSRRGCGYRK